MPQVIIDPTLKPLYANLKRLNIGEYLETSEFRLFMLEWGMDELWTICTREVAAEHSVVILGFHSTADDEKALMYLITRWLKQHSIAALLLPILEGFSKWKSVKVDFSNVITCLRSLNVPEKDINKFIEVDLAIQEQKPVVAEKEVIVSDNRKSPTSPPSNKVFIVHGHDDVSRLELCNVLKEEFKLEPVVLQDKPNDSFDTIIGKFERLASDCSIAIVLFTPDDEAGENKRARQNVLFELGYFLGKFQDKRDRRIIMLKKGTLEIPSDIAGVLYMQYSKSVKEVYYDLKKQLAHWGYTF